MAKLTAYASALTAGTLRVRPSLLSRSVREGRSPKLERSDPNARKDYELMGLRDRLNDKWAPDLCFTARKALDGASHQAWYHPKARSPSPYRLEAVRTVRNTTILLAAKNAIASS